MYFEYMYVLQDIVVVCMIRSMYVPTMLFGLATLDKMGDVCTLCSGLN